MNKICPLLLCLCLCRLTPQPVRAATGGEIAIAAGVAAGATVLGPVVAQAMTYSTIQVHVDGFAETIPLEAPVGGNLAAWENLSPDRRRSLAFSLNDPVALKRLRLTAGFGVLQATEVAHQLEQPETKFKQLVEDFDKTLGSLKTLFDSDPTNKTVIIVRDYFDERKTTSEALLNTIRDYRSFVRDAREDGNFSNDELTTASNRVERLKAQAHNYPVDTPSQVVSLFTGSLRAMFAESVVGPGSDQEKGELQRKVGTQIYRLLLTDAVPGKERLAGALHAALDVLRQAKAGSKNEFIFKEGNNQVTAQLNTDALTDRLRNLLQAVGIRTPVDRLLGYTSEKALGAALNTEWLPLAGARLSNDVLEAAFYGVTVGANFGPIINEVMQSVFSKSQMIDTLKDETRWQRLNFVESTGRAGDHNAVIYFDNALTPILKTATFDPSEFIEANMALYEKVTDAAAAIYGIPVTASGGGGAAPAANSLDSLNVFSLQARATKAMEGAVAAREVMIEILKQAITLHQEVQKKAKDKDTWNGANAAEMTTTAKAADKLVVEGLAGLAAKLSKAETK